MNHRSFPLSAPMPLSADDADRFIDLDRLFAAARRQAGVVALCASLGVALGVAYLISTPRTYTASTRILLDDSLKRYADDKESQPAQMQADSMMLSEVEILKSARLARAVAVDAKLNENQAFLNPPTAPVAWLKSQIRNAASLFSSSSTSVAAAQEAAIGKASALLQKSLSAERVGRSFVIDVSFEANDPALSGRVARAYAKAYLADQLEANFDATQQATVWLQGRLSDLQEGSQAAALEVERFRAEHGLTAARGELMSEQQLSDLNSQLILAQAETANALARYNQFKSIVDSGPDNAVRNATIPADKANSTVLNDLKTRYVSITKREADVTSRFGADHAQAVALRREQADVTQQIFGELQQLTESYRNEYEVAKSREDSLRANVGQMSGESSQAGQSLVQLRELEQKAAALSSLYQTFLARYEEASQQRSFPIAKARVITEASDPTSASSPRKSLTLGLSLVLGLFAGAGVGALREFRERFFRTAEDVRAALGINFLGHLPAVGAQFSNQPRSHKSDGDAPSGPRETVTPRILRVAINAPTSSFAETLRNTRLAADVVLQARQSKVIGFVSALPHEGKTTVAANFAGLLAASGARTLLIDGDMRNPGLSKGLSLTPEAGLVEALVGSRRWQSVVMTDRRTKLAIIPAVVRGRLSHTSELLSGQGMRELLDEAKTSYNYVVVDLPPLGPVVDAKAFAPLADAFVMVAEWGATPRALVRAALQAEPAVAAKLLGLILNKTDMKMLARYGAFGSAEHYFDRYASYYVEQPGVVDNRPG